jgi:hypothetical protein
VEPREKWEDVKLEEEAEPRVKEAGLKGASRSLVSLRSTTREVEPTTVEGLWPIGREIEEWLDHQLDTDLLTMNNSFSAKK